MSELPLSAKQPILRQAAVPLYRPELSGHERDYVFECLDSSWISSLGTFIDRFERILAEKTGAAHAVAVTNGTTALHLALHCLDLQPGDEVIVPTMTYIAPVNMIVQAGGVPVFAESHSSDWLIDPDDVARRITPRTRAILPVHLYGVACDMSALCELAERHGLAIVEDCAEALGTRLDGKHVGTFGAFGTFSFFGNKTVTTGEGGAVITDDDALAARLRQVKGQGQSLTKRYWHEVMGFNYRMTNIAAAIGTAQMERFEELLARKEAISAYYRRHLAHRGVSFQRRPPEMTGPDWLTSILLPPNVDRDVIAADMLADGIETRPVFYPAHLMPMHRRPESFEVAETIALRGLSLPSYPALTQADQRNVIEALIKALNRQGISV